MSVRNILRYPDPRLREPGKPVEAITPSVQALIDDMAETMYAAPGVGLAATQIGEMVRIFVMDTAAEGEPSQFRVFINPKIVHKEGEITWEEGCLSFPGVREEIERAQKARVTALDREGKPFEFEGEDLMAVAIQHEMDHLDGVLLIDRVSPLKRKLIIKHMQKLAAEGDDAVIERPRAGEPA